MSERCRSRLALRISDAAAAACGFEWLDLRTPLEANITEVSAIWVWR